jgi:gliding motility-associated-like protein
MCRLSVLWSKLCFVLLLHTAAHSQNLLKDNGFEVNNGIPSHHHIDGFNLLSDSNVVLCFGDYNPLLYNQCCNNPRENSYVNYNTAQHKYPDLYVTPFSPFPQGTNIMALQFWVTNPGNGITARKVGVALKCTRTVKESKKYFVSWYAFAVDTTPNTVPAGFYSSDLNMGTKLGVIVKANQAQRVIERDSLCLGLSDTFKKEGRIFHRILANPNQWSPYEIFFIADTTANWFTISNQGVKAGSNLFDDFKLFEIVHEQTAPAYLCLGDSVKLTPRVSVNPNSIRWNSNDSSSHFWAKDTGTYWVRYTDTLGMYIDTFKVSFGSDAHLGHSAKDTSMCEKDTLRLYPYSYPAAMQYHWSNGDTTLSTQVSKSGWISLKMLLDSCSSHIDSYYVKIRLSDSYPFFTDSFTCSDRQVTLFAYPQAGATLLWSTGSIADSIQATDSGWYWIRTSMASCNRTDSIHLKHEIKKDPGLRDSVICPGKKILLDATMEGYNTYEWNTGDHSALLYVNAAGTYKLKAYSQVCVAEDSCMISAKVPPPLPLPVDTIFCKGSVLKIGAGIPFYSSYRWNNGDTTAGISILAAGSYSVIASNSYCEISDSILVKTFPQPLWHIEQEQTRCLPRSEPVTLSASAAFPSYFWEPSSDTLPFTIINKQGFYSLTIKDQLGCSYKDSIYPKSFCEPYIYIPDAFSPNDDSLNDVFKPAAEFIESYNLKILDRWGQLLFESQDIEKGWNGTVKSMECPEGVYVWLISYEAPETSGNRKTYNKKGTLTLLRKYEEW